ncbi:MAG: hypothetical protein HZA51_18695 [Planctomycetes bacterium]|nr:hypothetical protein [Planctomycetota bacterium]
MTRTIQSFALSFAALSVCASIAIAEPTENTGAFPWEGEVTGTNVFVRSGAGNNWYPTMKVGGGDRVLVTGEKFGWYQIAPPAGSFSFIDSTMVDRKPGAKTGTVKQDKVYVRAGSKLEKRKSSTQLVLNKGATVEITGEDDGFYQIKPPAGATLFISKQYVKPVGAGAKTGLVEQHVSGTSEPATPIKPGDVPPAGAQQSEPPKTDPATPTTDANNAGQPTTPTEPGRTPLPSDVEPDAAEDGQQLDSDDGPASSDSTTPTGKPAATKKPATKPKATGKDTVTKKNEPAPNTPPTTGRYKALLTVVEGDMAAMLRKPFDEQDFNSIIKKYEPIANQSEEPIPSQIAKIRIKQLNDRASFRLVHSENEKDNKAIADLRANMDQERKKIMTRRYEKSVERYELEGELKESFAFAPENRRYRLVDPTTKMTIAYVDIPASVEGNPRHLVGQLVGIKVETKSFSPSARVPIAIAREVVDLSPRKLMNDGTHSPDAPAHEVMPPPEEPVAKDAAATGKPATTHEPAANAAGHIDSDN